jgi:hypothetical protein
MFSWDKEKEQQAMKTTSDMQQSFFSSVVVLR